MRKISGPLYVLESTTVRVSRYHFKVHKVPKITATPERCMGEMRYAYPEMRYAYPLTTAPIFNLVLQDTASS